MSQHPNPDEQLERLIKTLAKVDDLIAELAENSIWWLREKRHQQRIHLTAEDIEILKVQSANCCAEASQEDIMTYLTYNLPTHQKQVDKTMTFCIAAFDATWFSGGKLWLDWYTRIQRAADNAISAILECDMVTYDEDIIKNLVEFFYSLDRIIAAREGRFTPDPKSPDYGKALERKLLNRAAHLRKTNMVPAWIRSSQPKQPKLESPPPYNDDQAGAVSEKPQTDDQGMIEKKHIGSSSSSFSSKATLCLSESGRSSTDTIQKSRRSFQFSSLWPFSTSSE